MNTKQGFLLAVLGVWLANGTGAVAKGTAGAKGPAASAKATNNDPMITLFQDSRDASAFSFGLSFPHRNQPDTASAFEHRQTYDQLKNRLDNENPSAFPAFPAPFDQLDGMNFNFKYSF